MPDEMLAAARRVLTGRCVAPAEVPYLRRAATIVNDLAALNVRDDAGGCRVCRRPGEHDPRCPWKRARDWANPSRDA